MKCDSAHCPLLARVKQLEDFALYGTPLPDPDMERAVEASMRGDWGPLMRINEKRKEGCRSCGNRQSRMRNTGTPLFE